MPNAADISEHEPYDLYLQTARMWCLPLALGSCWFAAVIEDLWPRCHSPACHTYHDSHDQLVVPDPIENTGEHALFA